MHPRTRAHWACVSTKMFPEEGWKQWLERVTMIINENGLNTSDPASVELIEKHMVGFLFGEGDLWCCPGRLQTTRRQEITPP